MTEQPANQPEEDSAPPAAEQVDETPEELTRGLVEDVRRLEESN